MIFIDEETKEQTIKCNGCIATIFATEKEAKAAGWNIVFAEPNVKPFHIALCPICEMKLEFWKANRP